MQITDGKRFVDRLLEEGIPMTAACWLKETDGGLWYLYLVTPLIQEGRPRQPAQRRVNAVLRQMPEPFWIGYGETKLVGPDSPVGKALEDLYKRPRPSAVLRSGSSQFGGVEVDAIYPYPPPKAPV